jgi:hypothetical protein
LGANQFNPNHKPIGFCSMLFRLGSDTSNNFKIGLTLLQATRSPPSKNL